MIGTRNQPDCLTKACKPPILLLQDHQLADLCVPTDKHHKMLSLRDSDCFAVPT